MSSRPSHVLPPEVGAGQESTRDVCSERGTLIPAQWLEECARQALRGERTRLTSHFSDGLHECYEGPIEPIRRLILELFDAAGGGDATLTGSLQARRADWALLRLELDEPASWTRSEAQWRRLRRLATAVEGALGHHLSSEGRRQVWMTINLSTQD